MRIGHLSEGKNTETSSENEKNKMSSHEKDMKKEGESKNPDSKLSDQIKGYFDKIKEGSGEKNDSKEKLSLRDQLKNIFDNKKKEITNTTKEDSSEKTTKSRSEEFREKYRVDPKELLPFKPSEKKNVSGSDEKDEKIRERTLEP